MEPSSRVSSKDRSRRPTKETLILKLDRMAQLEEHPLARDMSTCRVARELGLSIQEVEKAAELFKAACSDDPVTADSVLTSKQLESVLCAQANVSATHELPAGLLETTSKA